MRSRCAMRSPASRPRLPPPNFPDPLEPFNRSVWTFNHALIVGVAAPIGRVYRLVIPRFVRDRIRDFASNLVFPRNFVANLLQGEWHDAGDETARFAVNTTLGLAGLWDPATRWLEIEAAPEDLGQVFARWGWRPSTFVVLPIAGPSSIRDGVGLLSDAALDPATYFFPAGPVLNFNEQVDSIEEYRRFAASSFDAYDDARLVWNLAREEQIEEPEIRTKGANTSAVQTLQAAFLGPRDPTFASRLDARGVTTPTTGRVLPYSYRMQREPAPLIFLVPGLGAHRLSASSVARARPCRDTPPSTHTTSTSPSMPSIATSERSTRTVSERASTSATRSVPSTVSTSPPKRRTRPTGSCTSIATCCWTRPCACSTG